jgi:hypothetical protein
VIFLGVITVLAISVGAFFVVRAAPHGPQAYPVYEQTPVTPVAPATPMAYVTEDDDSRPIVVDVNGDGVDDVLALASEGNSGRSLVVAFDGASLGNMVWSSESFDMRAPSLARAGQFVAVADAMFMHVLDLRTGKKVRDEIGAQRVWHPRVVSPNLFHLETAEDTTRSFEPVTGNLGVAITPTCTEDIDACLTRGERQRSTFGRLVGGKKPSFVNVDVDARAWIAGDRFIVRAPSKIEGHEIAIGGRRATGAIDWVFDAAGTAAPAYQSYTRWDVDARWDVDPDEGAFVIVTPVAKGAWLVKRSIATGAIVWEKSAMAAGAVTMRRDRIYVSTGKGIDVYDRNGEHVITLKEAPLVRSTH